MKNIHEINLLNQVGGGNGFGNIAHQFSQEQLEVIMKSSMYQITATTTAEGQTILTMTQELNPHIWQNSIPGGQLVIPQRR
jgi:hypothetical protein